MQRAAGATRGIGSFKPHHPPAIKWGAPWRRGGVWSVRYGQPHDFRWRGHVTSYFLRMMCLFHSYVGPRESHPDLTLGVCDLVTTPCGFTDFRVVAHREKCGFLEGEERGVPVSG